MAKCYTSEARKLENKLSETGITYNQFLELCSMYHELTIAGKAEVKELLVDKKEQ